MKEIQNIRRRVMALVFSSLSLGLLFFLATTAHATPAILDVRDVDTPGPDSVLHEGALTDGVRVYVDRESTQHWDNVPESLDGADYVEGAQENADARDDVGTSLLIEVDVAEGAVLYMFIDERLATPFPWMNFENFGADWVDTGLDIFTHRPDYQYSSCLDIWRTVGPLDAGTYNFRQMPEDAAFYGIAATFTAIPDNGVRGCPVITTVTIDVKPDSDPNSINPDAGGFLGVAILTTNIAGDDVADFYALDVDPSTLTFGPAGAAIARAAKVKDVDRDGDDDLILHFKISETGIVCGDTEVTLAGETFSGAAIEGTDAIKTRCK